MAAPVNIKIGQGTLNAASGSTSIGHGIGAQSNVLQILSIFVENNGSAAPTINAPFSDNAITWSKIASISHTELLANGEVSKDVPVRLEFWAALGAVTNGGTYEFTLSGSTDGVSWIYTAWTGEDLTHPYDLNASAIQTKSTDASAACDTTTTSDTNNVALIAAAARAAGSFADNPTFSTGSRDGGTQVSNFGGSTPIRHYLSYKAATIGLTSVHAGYSSATSNSNQANHELITIVITADAQSTGVTANGDTVTETYSLIPGAATNAVADGATITYSYQIVTGGAGEGAPVDGTQILEFAANATDAAQYPEADYDSIYSIGDRVASGLFTTGHHFGANVILFGTEDQNFDLNYANVSGSGLLYGDGGQNIKGGDGWWFNLGANKISVKGFKLLGADTQENGDLWTFLAGFGPGNVLPVSYASEFDAFTPAQPHDQFDAYTGLKAAEYLTTPRAPIPWAHWEFQWTHDARAGGSGTTRFCNEMHVKVAHSTLDGGDRRTTNGRPDKRVALTLGPGLVFRNAPGSNFYDPVDALFDGENYFAAAQNGHVLHQAEIGEGTSSTLITSPGKYLQFVFSRPVLMNHLVIQSSNGVEDYDSGGEPTLLGRWHWEISKNGGASWLALGGTWKFGEGAKYALAPNQAGWLNDPAFLFGDSSAPSQDGYTHWRMVFDGGSAFGGTPLNQIMFDLHDPGNTTVPLLANFSDTVDDALSGTPTVVAGNPQRVPFTDGDSDALSGTVTVIENPILTGGFTDGDSDRLTEFTSLSPSVVVQTVIISTGRTT